MKYVRLASAFFLGCCFIGQSAFAAPSIAPLGGGFMGGQASTKSAQTAKSTQTNKQTSHVAVYGRKSCSRTTAMMAHLKERNVSYRFYSIDDEKISKALFERIEKANMKQSGYALPIVEVGKKIYINPNRDTIAP